MATDPAMAGASESSTARVFFALWPGARAVDALLPLATELAAELGGKATRPDTLHLTLAFVGNVPASALGDLQAVAGETSAALGSLAPAPAWCLNRLGYWPHNRVLWAGSDHFPALLATLAAQLAGRVQRLGLGPQPPEHRFAPHVTLVRKALKAPPPDRLAAFKKAPVDWPCRDFVLVRSRPAAHGSAYETIGRWPLPG